MSEIWVIFLNWLFSRFHFFQFGSSRRAGYKLLSVRAMSVMVFSLKYAKTSSKNCQSPLKFLIGGRGGLEKPKIPRKFDFGPQIMFFLLSIILLASNTNLRARCRFFEFSSMSRRSGWRNDDVIRLVREIVRGENIWNLTKSNGKTIFEWKRLIPLSDTD